MSACEHCASTRMVAFTPDRHMDALGAVLLCQGCERVTIALPAGRRSRSIEQQELRRAA